MVFTVLGIAISYTFAFGYLVFIDAGFTWFIDYSDLPKFGLTFAVVGFPIGYSILASTTGGQGNRYVSEMQRLRMMIPYALVSIILFVMYLLTDLRAYKWSVGFSIFDASILPFVIFILKLVVDDYAIKPFDLRYMAILVLFTFFTVFCLGIDRGISQLQDNVSSDEIIMKYNNGHQIIYHGAVLITSLSHYSLILLEHKPVVIRTEDIESIKLEGK